MIAPSGVYKGNHSKPIFLSSSSNNSHTSNPTLQLQTTQDNQMICMYADSHLCTFTFILCTCIWIPLHRTTQLLTKILAFLVNPHHQLPDETPTCNLDLPVSHFRNVDNEEEVEEEEMCSICLVEFEKKDLVNKLARCGHTFHVECMEKWLGTCQFTCPLCRSRLLRHPSSVLPHCHS